MPLEKEVYHLQERVKTLEKFEVDHLELHQKLTEQNREMKVQTERMEKLLDPISKVFQNFNGFWNVGKMITIFVASAGVIIGGFYGLIRWLKN